MKKIVIVGASSGIGLRVAEEFAKRGVKVGLAARHTDSLKELSGKYPGMVEYVSMDVNTPESAEKLLHLIDKLGGMDVYFHVAGIGYDNPPLEIEREVRIVETNAVGFVRMVSAAYRYFRSEKKPGRIAAVTSVAGTKGIGDMAAYSASKRCASTYLTALEQLAIMEETDVSFTDIRPGWIRTPLLHDDQQYPLEMSLDYVVPRIIRAIVKRERVSVIDWRWNLVVGLWRCIPNVLWVNIGGFLIRKMS
ncbi:MAG: SDR family NAD(P)-dependent oxidoreductase [Muribaculaceae bacterium]|nr:SDR family NAD(P)-dependent oxidoreductase [Muribaculaceae bacterium]